MPEVPPSHLEFTGCLTLSTPSGDLQFGGWQGRPVLHGQSLSAFFELLRAGKLLRRISWEFGRKLPTVLLSLRGRPFGRIEGIKGLKLTPLAFVRSSGVRPA